MGGVDKSDQLCGYFRLGRSSKKWWKTCFFGLLNIVVVNSYVCYCQKNDKVPLRDFKMKLAKSMMDDYNSRKRPAPSLVLTAGASLIMQNHSIVNSKNKRVCIS